MTDYIITTDWQGNPIAEDRTVSLSLFNSEAALTVVADAPFFDNPPPAVPAGPTDALWEHDVVEVFFLGENEHYLEVELGPFGHYLVLMLHGRRRVTEKLLPLDYTAAIHGNRWTGRAQIPWSYLPKSLTRWNAYGIFTHAGKREHTALHPLSGDIPDFHRLHDFGIFPATVPLPSES